MKRLLLLLVVVGLLLIVIVLAMRRPKQPVTPQNAASPAEGVPSPTSSLPTAPTPSPSSPPTSPPATTPAQPQPPADVAFLSLQMPERIVAGTPVDVPVVLFGGGDVADLTVEIQLPSSHLQVADADPTTTGVQVNPGSLPEGATVIVNEVTPDGVVHYQISGLGLSDEPRSILSMSLLANAPTQDVLQITINQATLLRPDGSPVPVQTHAVLIEGIAAAQEGSPAPPEAEAISPITTPTAAPPAPIAAPTTQIAPGIYYRVQPRQTLTLIAQTFGSTAEEIAAANRIADPTHLPVGAVLRIPVTPPLGRAAYFVAPRDTLYTIAQTFGLSVATLAERNHLRPPYTIQAGQWLLLEE